MQQPASGLSDDQYNDRLRELEEEENAKRQALQELTQPEQTAPVPAKAEEQPVQQEQPAQTAQETTVTEEAAEPQEPEGEPKEGMTIESLEESTAGQLAKNFIPGQNIRDTAFDLMDKAGNAIGIPEEIMNHPLRQAGRDPLKPLALGMGDFGQRVLDKLTPFKIPEIPQYENQSLQGMRDIASIVLPAIYMKQYAVKGGAAAHSRIGWSLGNDKLFKFISIGGIEIGTGAIADSFDPDEDGHNAAGTLKKAWPKTWGWIPDSWATLDSDNADIKHKKRVQEGAYLGLALGMFEGFAKLVGAKKKSYNAYGWVPENERQTAYLQLEGEENIIDVKNMSALQQAEKYYTTNAETTGSPFKWSDLSKDEKDQFVQSMRDRGLIESVFDTPQEIAEAHVTRAQIKRDEMLDGLGDVRKEADPNPTEPQLGNHDMFTHREQGGVTRDNMGIYGAQTDQARINGNLGTRKGRLGSVYTESALENGLQLSTKQLRKIYKKAAQQLRAYDGVDYKGPDFYLTSKQISEAGDELAAQWLDPSMTAKDLKEALESWKTNTYEGVKFLDDQAYDAAIKATKGYFRQFLEMDEIKAAAILNHSLAGQVSDVAETVRHMSGTEAVARAQEMIMTRLEYLMAEKGVASYIAGRALNMKNRWKRMKTANQVLAGVQNGEIEMSELIKKQYGDAKQTLETLRGINKERPEFLGPMMLAYELTNGKIHTMDQLNTIVKNNMGTISKAFVDGAPEIPSMVVDALMSNYYNSLLTSISTPAKAGLGNLVQMALKPLNLFLGSAVTLDGQTMQRAWIQYSAFGESLSRGFEHMAKVFSMASEDPNSVSYIMRDDLVKVNKDNLMLNKAYAEAAADAGNDGPLALVTMLEEVNDLAEHPWLRFGANAMTAFDGFTRAMIGSSEARIRAFDRLRAAGVDVTEKTLKEATEVEYAKLFDDTGMITDDAVDYSSREVALSLDNRGVDALNSMIKHFPLLKGFLLFPRTAANAVGVFNQSLPLSAFAKDINELAYRPTKSFNGPEIERILSSRGISTEGDVIAKFKTLKKEILGRKAMGMVFGLGASYMFMQDRLRGDGHWKKEVQKVRREADWQPRTYKGWDGKWYSYDGMGPLSDWLALTANVMDNFDELGTAKQEELQYKLAFVLAASVTQKSWMGALEPMLDVMQGNPAAMARWGATSISGLLPFSGVRREIGQIMYPGLREVEDNLMSQLRNRNAWLDGVDPEGALPRRFSWVEGDKVGYSDNLLTRILNATLPFKQYDEPSPREQFLIDIQFDVRPIMNKSDGGFKYTPQMKEELYKAMGSDPSWQRAIDAAMKKAAYTKWVERLREARRKGLPNEQKRADQEFMDKGEFERLYWEVESAMRSAKNRAEENATFKDQIRAWEANAVRQQDDARAGVIPLPYR